MSELPFSPDIETFAKPAEMGLTNDMYYDPEHPEVIIRIPKDQEARFLENDPKRIGLAKLVPA